MRKETPREAQIRRLREQQNNDWFFDNWEGDFDRHAKRAFRFGFFAVLTSMALGLVTTAVLIWAVVELVQWLTSK